MNKFEYHEERYDWSSDVRNLLNDLGSKGWELVSVVQELDGKQINNSLRTICLRYTFKRQITI
jgi:hypothetical protein